MMLVTRKIALARILTGTMSTVLYEVEPTDPFVFTPIHHMGHSSCLLISP